MAITVSAPTKGADVWGKLRVRVGVVTFDSSYATGGEAITAAQFGLQEIQIIIPVPRAAGRIVQPNAAKTALLVYEDGATVLGTLDEVPNATDLSALVVDVLVVGI